ncbi:MAG: DUF2752 domain-containing protein [Acidimicrobiales bacterium]
MVIPCPLRTVMGIPCPLCGMTTASVAVLRGDLGAAVSANPFVFLLVASSAAVLVVVACRAAGYAVRIPALRLAPMPLLIVLALTSWAFQLHRFELI